MNPEKNYVDIRINDVADMLYEELVEYGYVPTSDEVLDIAEIVMTIIIHYFLLIEGEVEKLEEDTE